MIILGIDPGSRHTGYGLIEERDGRWRVRAAGRFSVPPALPMVERLGSLAAALESLVATERPDAAALEKPFHGINARSALVLAEARGALLGALARAGLTVEEYAPAEIKSAVAGSGRADKAQVARMVRLQLACPDLTLSSDASDALAVALCAAARLSWNRRVSRAASGK
ncbi:MAG: crossover junction endodeoxyribonuclease RuvC [Thermoanaerobaculia bacterium]